MLDCIRRTLNLLIFLFFGVIVRFDNGWDGGDDDDDNDDERLKTCLGKNDLKRNAQK